MKKIEKKIIINYIYSVIYHVFSLIVPLILTPYLSRVLGAHEIGKYAYEYSVSSYFALFVILGTKNYGSKVIAYFRDDKRQITENFWNIYSMQIIATFFVSLFYFIYILKLAHSQEIALPLYLIILANGIDITWFFWGLEEFKYTVIRDLVIKVITTLLVLFSVSSTEDTWKYAVIISAGMFVSQSVLWIRFFREYGIVRPQIKSVMKHIKPNLMMFIPIAAVNVYKTMDKVMLGVMANSEEVGYYYSSEKIINVPLALVTSLNSVMLPRISYLRGRDEDTTDILVQSLFFSVGITTMISVGILAAASKFVPLFYGVGYDKCIVIFYILLPASTIIAFTNVICSQYLIPNDKTNIYAGARVVGAIANLIANAIFIPVLLSYGAAVGTLITEIVVCTIQLIFTRRQLPILKMITIYVLFAFSGLVTIRIVSGINTNILSSWGVVITKAFIGVAFYVAIVIIWGYIYWRSGKGKYEKQD